MVSQLGIPSPLNLALSTLTLPSNLISKPTDSVLHANSRGRVKCKVPLKINTNNRDNRYFVINHESQTMPHFEQDNYRGF